jgi:hypothetical protein
VKRARFKPWILGEGGAFIRAVAAADFVGRRYKGRYKRGQARAKGRGIPWIWNPHGHARFAWSRLTLYQYASAATQAANAD